MNQTIGVSETQTGDLGQSLKAAAAEFSSNVQEATTRLSTAAEQFASISERLATAADQVQSASDRAEAAQRAAEAVQSRIERDHADLTSLMRDLQERIAALAVLARPMPGDLQSTETQMPPAEESSAPPETSTPSWSGGWQSS